MNFLHALRFAIWPPLFGVRSMLRHIKSRWDFWQAYQRYCEIAPSTAVPEKRLLYPCLHDKTEQTPIDVCYYFQDAWAFEKIYSIAPPEHVDVGSHHKFVSLLSKIIPTTMVDIRPLPVRMDSVKFKQGTILDLPFLDGSIPSVSSLCVIEHIGLGRYGDPLDPAGTEKALEELKRIVAPGGHLYISVPIDDVNRTYFNAHRAFSELYLLTLFAPFEVLAKYYIYGKDCGTELRPGFGTGCYHLRRPL